MKEEIKDLLLMIKSRDKYKEKVFNKYNSALSSFDDLIGDGYDDVSLLFYLINRHYLYWLDNDPNISVLEKDILFRRKFYNILKKIGPLMLGCTQVIENRNFINNTLCNEPDLGVKLPKEPVIFVANHGFRDDVLATVLAAQRHAYLYCGSLPLFYNTFEGFAVSLVGSVMVNRKSKESRISSIDKMLKVMQLGTDLTIFPEGGWNKSSEILTNNLWNGVYKMSCLGNYLVVPIAHYVRDLEVVNKKNIIHTVVDEPIPLYEMDQKEGLMYLRDCLSSWQYKMAEVYGTSSRNEELKGFLSSDDKWKATLDKRMKYVSRYDSSIEKKSDYRPKDILRAEEVYLPIANIQNVTSQNIQHVLYAKQLVKEKKNIDFQRLY